MALSQKGPTNRPKTASINRETATSSTSKTVGFRGFPIINGLWTWMVRRYHYDYGQTKTAWSLAIPGEGRVTVLMPRKANMYRTKERLARGNARMQPAQG